MCTERAEIYLKVNVKYKVIHWSHGRRWEQSYVKVSRTEFLQTPIFFFFLQTPIFNWWVKKEPSRKVSVQWPKIRSRWCYRSWWMRVLQRKNSPQCEMLLRSQIRQQVDSFVVFTNKQIISDVWESGSVGDEGRQYRLTYEWQMRNKDSKCKLLL